MRDFLIATIFFAVASAKQEPVADFYVSTKGNDAWSGRLPEPNATGTDGPFATLARARDAIRELKGTGRFTGPVTVMVRGGTYYLSESVIFSAEDSGTEECSIMYIAYPGEHPALSGAKPVTGWKPYKEKIMQCTLPEVKEGKWYFRQLFFNGKRQIRARYPNYDKEEPLYGGWAFVAEPIGQTAFRYHKETFQRRWDKPTQGEVNIFPWLCWNNDIVPIKHHDQDNCIIKLARPLIHRLNQASKKLDFMSLMAGNRFYVENLLEELDQPGEWCLDTETGVLYFWPPTGRLSSGEVTAPAISRLIEFRGSTGEPVKHIKISGFTFTQTLSLFPQPDVLPHNYPNSGGHAVYLEGAEDCTIENCFFDAVGGDAIRLQNYNAHNHIIDNEIAYSGAQGICIAGFEQELPAWASWKDTDMFVKLSRERPKSVRNIISRNHIHHCGVIDKRGSGIYIFGINSVDNVISHNLIHHIAHRGIMIVHGFGRNIVEYNELHHLCLEASDTGGINTLVWYVVEGDEELGHGNVIRYNLVREVVGCGAYGKPYMPTGKTLADKIWTPYYGWGIYLDWNAMKTTVYGNIVIGNTLGGIMMLGDAKDNLIENNIFVNSSHSQIYYASMSDKARGNRFVRNIVYYTAPEALLIRIGRLPNKQAIAESDYNIFFPPAGQTLTIDLPDVPPEESFAKWRQLGYEAHSIVANPLFVDPANGDFRLRPDSPAFRLGFQAIDVSRIGLPALDSQNADEQ